MPTQFVLPNVKQGRCRCEKRVRKENRIVFDITTAHVGKPGDVVEGRNNMKEHKR